MKKVFFLMLALVASVFGADEAAAVVETAVDAAPAVAAATADVANQTLKAYSMIAAGVVLLVTNKKMLKGALVQMVPPLLGFFFLAFHIIEKIKGAN